MPSDPLAARRVFGARDLPRLALKSGYGPVSRLFSTKEGKGGENYHEIFSDVASARKKAEEGEADVDGVSENHTFVVHYLVPLKHTAVASNRRTEALASVISFTFVVYSHYKHS